MIASTWDLATFKDLDLLTFGNDNIVSTWDLSTFEGLCAALTIAGSLYQPGI